MATWRHGDRATLDEFLRQKGILYPVYADRVFTNPFKYNDNTDIINNITNLMDGKETCSNKIIGYFAAIKGTDINGPKYTTSMSFCVPEDYCVFRTKYAKFLAMTKCINNNGLLVHVSKHQRVIISDGYWPIYYFNEGNTIGTQYYHFEMRCERYFL
jgi:hypothetical protein